MLRQIRHAGREHFFWEPHRPVGAKVNPLRIATTAVAGLLGIALGAVASLYLAMWIGSLVSSYEPGTHLGLMLAFLTVPVGGITIGCIAAVVTWRLIDNRVPGSRKRL